ncbi:hypothetical protein ACWGH8_14525 [Nonomuraea muscovyensis]|uniref:Uncharacterized protein n=1 Tax=Nonomuraea muscovyensis TaxID=1124761 RepID=A0A7X0EXJ8_9ACTN|nr:hypothetical protein [Nonomuraea muscovyensis]MBB6344736.1 hypothetical protein [Nonomuraea muscovyensis]
MNELRRLARVRDEELAGRASGAGARTLLATVTATDVHTAPDVPGVGDERGAARRRRARRLLLGAVVTAAVVTAVAAGPGLLGDRAGTATSYANAAMEIELQGDYWVARVRDPFADHHEYAEAFRAVGLDIDLQLLPVSPSRVGEIVRMGFSGATGPSKGIGGDREPAGCTFGQEDCLLKVTVGRDFTGKGILYLGRMARPGERYQSAGTATRKGEMLAGFRVDERPVGEVVAEARRRGLEVVFQIIEPQKSGRGYSVDPDARPRAVGDGWIVWEAEADRPGVVRLLVTEERLPRNPVYGGPKPPVLTSG